MEVLGRFHGLDQLQLCLGVKGIRVHFLCCTKEKSQHFHPDAQTPGPGREKTAALLHIWACTEEEKGRKIPC